MENKPQSHAEFVEAICKLYADVINGYYRTGNYKNSNPKQELEAMIARHVEAHTAPPQIKPGDVLVDRLGRPEYADHKRTILCIGPIGYEWVGNPVIEPKAHDFGRNGGYMSGEEILNWMIEPATAPVSRTAQQWAMKYPPRPANEMPMIDYRLQELFQQAMDGAAAPHKDRCLVLEEGLKRIEAKALEAFNKGNVFKPEDRPQIALASYVGQECSALLNGEGK